MEELNVAFNDHFDSDLCLIKEDGSSGKHALQSSRPAFTSAQHVSYHELKLTPEELEECLPSDLRKPNFLVPSQK